MINSIVKICLAWKDSGVKFWLDPDKAYRELQVLRGVSPGPLPLKYFDKCADILGKYIK